jgi:hypothetical protein
MTAVLKKGMAGASKLLDDAGWARALSDAFCPIYRQVVERSRISSCSLEPIMKSFPLGHTWSFWVSWKVLIDTREHILYKVSNWRESRGSSRGIATHYRLATFSKSEGTKSLSLVRSATFSFHDIRKSHKKTCSSASKCLSSLSRLTIAEGRQAA